MTKFRTNNFGASGNSGNNLLSSLFGDSLSGVKDSITSSLPTKQEAIQGYLAATVAFWIIGGVTLYILKKTK